MSMMKFTGQKSIYKQILVPDEECDDDNYPHAKKNNWRVREPVLVSQQ